MLNVPLTVIAAHFVGDWYFQTDFMALNKSKDWRVLLWHVVVCHFYIALVNWKLALLVAPVHFCIDFVTSRWTGRLFFFQIARINETEGVLWRLVDGKRHNFFVAIGFDQLLHYFSYAVILRWLN